MTLKKDEYVSHFLPFLGAVLPQVDVRNHVVVQLLVTWHIEAETKRLPISWHFQIHFLEWKYMNFDSDFTEVYSQGHN